MFGSHLSIAGGMCNALSEGERLGLDTVQVFTKNQQQWKCKPLADDAVREWRAHCDRLGWTGRTVSHASYLINLASPDDELWNKSIDLMTIELERCEALGIPLLVHHPGAYTTSDEESGLKRIADAYRELFTRTAGFATVSCLENTVGSGSNLGAPFEQLARLADMIAQTTEEPERLGFCFDTCHAHAAGYDMASRPAAEATLQAFDAACGIHRLRVVHLNDSKGVRGSRRDRHAHIGEGTIGGGTAAARLARSGFAAVVNHPALAGVPKILETPKEDTAAGTPMDRVNLRRLRKLIEGGLEVGDSGRRKASAGASGGR